MTDFDALLSRAYENTDDGDLVRSITNPQDAPIKSLTPKESQYIPLKKIPSLVENETASGVTPQTWDQIAATPEFIGTVSGMAACALGMLALWLNE